MPIEYTLESLDTVKDEAIKALYIEDNGKFQLDLDAYAEHVKKPVLAKNSDLVGRLNKIKPIADRFKDVPDDEWKSYQEWKASQNGDDDDDDGGDKSEKEKFDPKKFAKQLKSDLAKEYDAKIKAKEDELAAERAKFDSYRFDQELTGAALENSVIGTRLKKFKSAAIAEGVFGFKDGKLVVLDEDGEPSTDSVADKFKTLAEAEDWKFFFEAKEAGGGSGEQKQAGSKGGKNLKRSKMTSKEKSDFIKANGGGDKGLQAFLSLPY